MIAWHDPIVPRRTTALVVATCLVGCGASSVSAESTTSSDSVTARPGRRVRRRCERRPGGSDDALRVRHERGVHRQLRRRRRHRRPGVQGPRGGRRLGPRGKNLESVDLDRSRGRRGSPRCPELGPVRPSEQSESGGRLRRPHHGDLDHPINRDELDVEIGAAPVWTGSSAAGNVSTNDHCTSWTATSQSLTGRVGSTGSTSTTWSDDASLACPSMARLYCFES